jgi:hypothetical protein
MNQIPPYHLWIGHAGDGRDYRRLLDLGIRAVVQLAVEEPPLQPPRELIYLRFPLRDGADNPDDLLAWPSTRWLRWSATGCPRWRAAVPG